MMRNQTKEPRRRRAALIALGCVIAGSLAAGALASVTIYTNDFKAKHEFKTVSKAAGGKACERFWHKKKAFGIEAKKKTECAYEIPVFSDGSGGNLNVKTFFKAFSANTTSKIRKGTFGFLALRASNSARYQLRVFPKGRRWELRRGPASGQFPVKGKLKQIAPFDKRNDVQMRVSGDKIDVWVQGKAVVKGLVDSSAAQVSGSGIRIGIGQANKAKRPTSGIFNKVRVDLPKP